MGLAIELSVFNQAAKDPEWIGELERAFNVLNQELRDCGYAEHTEPRDLGPLASRAGCSSFPYEYTHYLRRVYAHVLRDSAFVAEPQPDSADPADDRALNSEYDELRSHLICHSDCEGYYVPVDFDEPLATEAEELAGCVCSSLRLIEELVEVAPALGIDLADGELSDDEAARVNRLAASNEGLFRERTVWIALYEAARLSLENGTAIAFL